MRLLIRLACGLLLGAISQVACAHRDDYLDETFVYRTVGRGETEIEPALDRIHPDDGDPFLRGSLGVEHGFTDRFMLDGVASFDHGGDRDGLARWRIEGRYRFGEENPHGFSPAVSLEYEDDRVERSRRLTPRLVLNRDFAAFNLTLNLLREFELEGGEGDAWGYSLGMRYGEDTRLRYGLEIKQTFGRSDEGLVIPQMFVRLAEGADIKVGYAKGLTRASDDFLRVLFEFELGDDD